MMGEDHLPDLSPSSDHTAASTRTKLAHRLRGCQGQALVEFALVLPLVLLLALGMLDLGTAINDRNNMTQMADVAARYAAIGSCGASCTSIYNQVVLDADNAGLTNGGGATGPHGPLKICFSFPNSTSNEGDPVQVTVSTNYVWLPYLHLASIQIQTTATMRLEASYSSFTSPPYTATCYT
jgi:Flp pilus assembly protein TadG